MYKRSCYFDLTIFDLPIYNIVINIKYTYLPITYIPHIMYILIYIYNIFR